MDSNTIKLLLETRKACQRSSGDDWKTKFNDSIKFFTKNGIIPGDFTKTLIEIEEKTSLLSLVPLSKSPESPELFSELQEAESSEESKMKCIDFLKTEDLTNFVKSFKIRKF